MMIMTLDFQEEAGLHSITQSEDILTIHIYRNKAIINAICIVSHHERDFSPITTSSNDSDEYYFRMTFISALCFAISIVLLSLMSTVGMNVT